MAAIVASPPATAAAVMTQSYVRAAPVYAAEAALAAGEGRVAAVLVNSGQANAGTGRGGVEDCERTVRAVAAAVGCGEENVLVASTGMIGKRFDIGIMERGVPEVIGNVGGGREDGVRAAQAIMTTDLKRKEAAFRGMVNGKEVVVGGMCKGSGMIHPDMATMLAFVTCDAQVERGLWQGIIGRAADRSFNMITVDGDTSTNDVLFGLCHEVKDAGIGGEGVEELEAIVTATCVDLAKQIARDGEGATVLMEVRVTGAASESDARAVARTVAGSSLLKAAVHGRDPNWGRIAAAAGRAGVKVVAETMMVTIGETVLMIDGEPVEYDAAAASGYMKAKAACGEAGYCSEGDTVVIEVGLGMGEATATAWGCDLSKEYVAINSEYST